MHLTIVLLTFNRPQKALERIIMLAEIIRDCPLTELVVIENLSENTIDGKLIPSQQNVKFIKKNINQGIDRSILQAAAYCKRKKKRIWYLCDDDIIFEKNIIYIINELQKASDGLVYVPWLETDGKNNTLNMKDAYIRMSFLPCLSLTFEKIGLKEIRKHIGTNYCHIALMNRSLKSNKNIIMLQNNAGQQTPNATSRFPILNTFFYGYASVLSDQKYLSETEIQMLIYSRAYAAISLIKNNDRIIKTKIEMIKFLKIIPLISLKLRCRYMIKVLIA